MSKRLKFFLTHLAISAFIALLVICVVFLLWYPAPLAKAVGVTHIFLMMLTIDVIIGPVLGLIVYKEGKKTLKMDLGIIILLQLSALGYGIYSIEQGRPVWIAYNVDRFDLVRVNEIDTRNLAQAKVEYQIPSYTQPKYVAAVIPTTNLEKKNQILFDELGSGIAPSQRPELYQPLETVYPNIVKRALPLTQLEQFNNSQLVKQTLEKYPQADSFVPLKANAVDMTVLIDKKSGGKVVAIADLRPWK